MTSKKLFFILIGILVLLAAITGGGVYLGNNFLKERTQEIVSLKAQSLALDEQQRSLVKAKQDINVHSDLENIAKVIVPQEKDQARTVREITRFAEESGVGISSITFPASTLGQQTTGKRPAASAKSQVEPVEGIPGVSRLEITVQSDTASPVLFTSLLDFLERLEQNRRTSHVTNLTVTPSSNNRNFVTFSLIINVYIKQ